MAVAHNEFKSIKINNIEKMYKDGDSSAKVLIDVKGIFGIDELNNSGMMWWRL